MGVDKIKSDITDKFEGREISNTDMVQIIEHCGAYLNLKTIPQYAKDKGMTYNGVKRYRNVKELFGAKFVIDNGK